MVDWLSANAWVIWLVAAGALAVTELVTLDFTLLMLAAGALAGGVAGLFFPGFWLVQVVVAIVVATSLLMLLRPTLLRRIREAPGYRSSLARMVGSTGRTLTEIDAHSGEVKVLGEVWTARSYDGAAIPAGAEVEVFEVDGTTAVVYPKDQPQLP